jgi:hypothetical protein
LEAIVLAYDFPLLSLMWAMFVFFLLFSVFFAVVWAFIDNFRRRDYGGWAKAGWAVVILFIPIVGMLVYIGMRPADALDPL